ncbi:MAG TPA: hypothetical protein VLU46_09420, partial [Thermoanaerobaculia bacterium]|nr:hypothetical protein [Thermoanaerobaculia bacterium]
FGVVLMHSARADEAAGRIRDGEVIGYAAKSGNSGSRTFAPVVVYRDRFSRFALESPLARRPAGARPSASSIRCRRPIRRGASAIASACCTIDPIRRRR